MRYNLRIDIFGSLWSLTALRYSFLILFAGYGVSWDLTTVLGMFLGHTCSGHRAFVVVMPNLTVRDASANACAASNKLTAATKKRFFA